MAALNVFDCASNGTMRVLVGAAGTFGRKGGLLCYTSRVKSNAQPVQDERPHRTGIAATAIQFVHVAAGLRRFRGKRF